MTDVADVLIVGRQIFYERSAFDDPDGNGPLTGAGANASDDSAIATDKQALLPGQSATFANYTSYRRGINGIMIDVADLTNANGISAADFDFKVGNDNTPAGWSVATAPISITVRQGAGQNGSDRITVIWADNAIEKQWLQVTLKATVNTGLATDDVHYWGNAVGEVGDSTADQQVMVFANCDGLFVGGMNLNIQIGDGGPVLGNADVGAPGVAGQTTTVPGLTNIDVTTDTIFSGGNLSNVGLGADDFFVLGTTSVDLAANVDAVGKVATLTFDVM